MSRTTPCNHEVVQITPSKSFKFTRQKLKGRRRAAGILGSFIHSTDADGRTCFFAGLGRAKRFLMRLRVGRWMDGRTDAVRRRSRRLDGVGVAKRGSGCSHCCSKPRLAQLNLCRARLNARLVFNKMEFCHSILSHQQIMEVRQKKQISNWAESALLTQIAICTTDRNPGDTCRVWFITPLAANQWRHARPSYDSARGATVGDDSSVP